MSAHIAVTRALAAILQNQAEALRSVGPEGLPTPGGSGSCWPQVVIHVVNHVLVPDVEELEDLKRSKGKR